MADAAQITVLAIGAVSAGTGTGAAVDLGERRTAAEIALRITAATAALATTLETSADGSTGWREVLRMDTVQEPALLRYAVDSLDRYVRVTWDAAAATTFGLDARAHQLYAE